LLQKRAFAPNFQGDGWFVARQKTATSARHRAGIPILILALRTKTSGESRAAKPE